MNMESQPQEGEFFYGTEAILINQAERCVDEIEKLRDSMELSEKDLLKMNNLVEHMVEYVIPYLKTEKTAKKKGDYVLYISNVDSELGIEISEYMESKVNNDYVLTKEQIGVWEKMIQILKTKVIPRMEKEGLEDVVHELQGAIIQSEIKIAHDKPTPPAEFEKIP